MSRDFSLTRSIVALVAIFAGGVGITHADDNSLGRFSDDIYSYVDQSGPFPNNAPSAFHKTRPDGLSAREYQELSSEGAVWHPAGAADRAQSTFHESRPTGLSNRDYQALSSNSSLWQSPKQPSLASRGSTNAGSKTVAR